VTTSTDFENKRRLRASSVILQ